MLLKMFKVMICYLEKYYGDIQENEITLTFFNTSQCENNAHLRYGDYKVITCNNCPYYLTSRLH